ncbi:MAG: hypothetical protein HY536_00585 [Candidatus Colwellbacteria bacterium]|nr:hypothetical protein [Candidatus Colwellbacteria bacterium]
MEKLYIDKNDGASIAARKIGESRDTRVTLYIPKNSILRSEADFSLIAREAAKLKKELAIESVDDDIVALAEKAGLAASNPFFSRQSRVVGDILPARRGARARSALARKGVEAAKRVGKARQARAAEEKETITRVEDEGGDEAPRDGRGVFLRTPGTGALVGVTLAVVGVIAASAIAFLPQAKIELVFEETSWASRGAIVAAVNAKSAGGALSVPAQIFRAEKSGVFEFPATGSQTVSKKATGVITIYNAFSVKSQDLVRGTRFAAPDGTIVRLASAVTIPGAKRDGDTLVPSSVEADVVADAAGGASNIGPVAVMTIPGFKGTPQYTGFHGEIKKPLRGGAEGEVKVPTREDIEGAKASVEQTLRDAVALEMKTKVPEDLVTLSSAAETKIMNVKADEIADEKGNFSLGLSAEARLIAFRESDVIEAFKALFQREEKEANLEPRDAVIEYGAVDADFDAEIATIQTSFQAKWSRPFDEAAFRERAAGLNEQKLRNLIFTLPGVSSATVEFWPFWVRAVPARQTEVAVRYEE